MRRVRASLFSNNERTTYDKIRLPLFHLPLNFLLGLIIHNNMHLFYYMRQDSGSQSVFRGTITRVPLHHTTSCRNPKLVSQRGTKYLRWKKKIMDNMCWRKKLRMFSTCKRISRKKRIADKP